MRRFLLLIAAILPIVSSFAQTTPVITSLDPYSGAAGTEVTIDGTGFASSAPDNIVFFGKKKASVISATATEIKVQVPAGATYGSVSVTSNGLTAYSVKPFLPRYTGSVIGPGTFLSKISYDTGVGAESVELADLDNDGKLDILVINRDSYYISLYRNTTSNSTQTSFAEELTYHLGYGADNLAAGDLDGDGKADVVVMDKNTGRISILKNTGTPGKISFQRSEIAGLFAAFDALIRDVDYDGKPDIITADLWNRTITVLRNEGGSTGITFSKSVYQAPYSPTALIMTDVDGDGIADLIAANTDADGSSFSVFKNLSKPGQVSLAGRVDIAGEGGNLKQITSADYDGDGLPDIAVTNTASRHISVYKNTSTTGNISFPLTEKTDYPATFSAADIISADLNDDGKADLLVANSNGSNVSILKNASSPGTINFGEHVDYQLPGPSGLALTDLNDDKKPDLAVSSRYRRELFILNGHGNASEITAFLPSNGLEGETVTITGKNLLNANSVYFGGRPAASFTVNSSTSISAIIGKGNTGSVSVTLPHGIASLNKFRYEANVPIISTISPASASAGSTITVNGANFNQEAEQNFVYFGPVKGEVMTATTSSLLVKVPLAAANQPISVTAKNLTGTSARTFYPSFPGTTQIDINSFRSKIDFTAGIAPTDMVAADFDGDQKVDIVTVNSGGLSSAGTLGILRNTSSSGSSAYLSQGSITAGSNPAAVSAPDMNRDGKPDLLWVSKGSNSFFVSLNTSQAGSISFTSPFAFQVNAPSTITAGDLDLDGKPDVVVGHVLENRVSIYRNVSINDTTQFSLPQVFTADAPVTCIAIGDMNNDKTQDLVIGHATVASVLIYGGGSTPDYIGFGPQLRLTAASTVSSLKLNDIDGDGKVDIVTTGAAVSAFRNTNTGNSLSFSTGTTLPFSGTSTGLAVADLDGDRMPEVVISDKNNNNASVYKNTSTSGLINFSSAVNFATGAEPAGILINDFDGDGVPDLAAANSSTSANSVSILRNLTNQPEANAASVPKITSFSPSSGVNGTSVTITGTNFSPTPGNNIVYFGAVKAQVQAASSTSLTVAVPLSATFAPITVTVNNLTAYSQKPFMVKQVNPIQMESKTFSPKSDFPTGGVNSVAVGDLDGDGKSEIIATSVSLSPHATTIAVLKNTGSREQISFDPKLNFTTGESPSAAALGDFNGDGKLDVVTANQNGNSVSVLINNTAGTISFQPKIDLTTGINPSAVAVTDIDQDGKPDIVVTNGGEKSFSIFRNTSTNGTVSFADKVDFAAGSSPVSLAIADFDGDGKPDVAVGSMTSTTIDIRRNESSIGSISFAGSTYVNASAYLLSLAAGDLNNDNKPDLIAANDLTHTVSVIKNTSTIGSISFDAKADYPTGKNPRGLALNDLDGDGLVDVAVANFSSNSISVLRNTSTSSISLAETLDLPTGQQPSSVALADLDNDNRTDILAANSNSFSSSVSVILNAPKARPFIQTFAPASGAAGTTVTIQGANFSPIAAENIVFFGAVKAKVTAATVKTLTVTVPLGATYEPISVTTNELTAFSAKPFHVLFPGAASTFTQASFEKKTDIATGRGPRAVSLADFDGDGKADMVSANVFSNTISVFRNTGTNGNAALAEKLDLPANNEPVCIAIADVTRDGKLDLITTNYNSGSNSAVSVYKNTSTPGAISFATKVDYADGLRGSYGVAATDFDGDGKTDLVLVNQSSNTASVFRNISTEGTVSFAAKVDFLTGDRPYGIAIGDFNMDGKPDFAVTNRFSNTVSVHRNTSNVGTISFAAGIQFTTGSDPLQTAVADLDADGKLDIAVLNTASNTVSVLKNISTNGSIAFAGKVDYYTGSGPNGIAITDLDGEGKPDLAIVNFEAGYGTTVSVLKNTSTNTALSFDWKVDYATGLGADWVSAGDVNNDGRPDLVVANYTDNSISILPNKYQVPDIRLFSPATAAAGDTVMISGVNLGRVTEVKFGGTAATFIVKSPTHITATLGTGSSGTVSVTSPEGSDSVTGFTFIPKPAVFTFSPPVGGSGTTITISGTNLSGATAVKFGGTAAASFTVNSATSITAVVGAGSTGSVSVETPGGEGTIAGFTYIAGPVINSFNPLSGKEGTTVTISGTNFSGATAVSFGDVSAASFTVVSPTTITAVVGAGGAGPVSVKTAGGTASKAGFNFTAAPLITSFDLSRGSLGSVVTITGTNLSDVTAVSFGGSPASSFTVVSATTIKAVVGEGATGRISVTSPGGVATSNADFTYLVKHTISSFAPTEAGEGERVTITGTNFSENSVVMFGNYDATSVIFVSPTTLIGVVGKGSSGSVTVSAQGWDVSLPGFTFLNKPAPTLTGFTPSAAAKGTRVTISGQNFTGTTSVSFGGVEATWFSVESPNTIIAIVDGGADGQVKVTTAGGSATKSGFSFIKAPVITSFSPAVGGLGSTITITGENLAGVSAVSIGGTPAASFTLNSPTSVSAVVGSAASGAVSVTTAGGSTSKEGFTFIPKPFISAAGNTTFITGGKVNLNFSSSLNIPVPYTLQWSRNGVPILGANGTSYEARSAGSYSVMLSAGSFSISAEPVEVKVIFALPPDNFNIRNTNETCRSSNDGSVKITAKNPMSYNARITGGGINADYTFSISKDINNLGAGKYSVCITVPDQPGYQQCYSVSITEPEDLAVYTNFNEETNKLRLQMAGGENYVVDFNGTTYTTKQGTIELPLVNGTNRIKVRTGKDCQGVFERVINLLPSARVYPNPFDDLLNLSIPNPGEDIVMVRVLSTSGTVVYEKIAQLPEGQLQLNLQHLQPAMYILSVKNGKHESLLKVIKK
ncbi:FG-GAP-like repeat-containing protein [Pedobacter sp. SYSU D00535]|uniref:FG-GAP-like repeat-containing protein n=1 Tax=Pedobacter sp. SYSU D00535 TaxID=2810308 RepID=UPI001A9713CD|nr:FG-GAP-like repeat-containing protein [Pedobacter sp. SYSU D00535]